MHPQSLIVTTIIDIGTAFTKAGYVSSTLPSIYAPSQSHLHDYISPLKNSRIQNMDNYLSILKDSFQHVPSEDLIIILNNEPRIIKERIIEYLYETKMINNILLHESSLLSLFSYGKTTGIVIDFSESVSVVAVVGGLIAARKDFNYGGEDVTNLFVKDEIKEFMTLSINDMEARNNKHISDNYRRFMVNTETSEIKKYILSLNYDQKKCYELMGHTLWYTNEYEESLNFLVKDLTEAVREVLEACAEDCKYPLLSNIVLSGGSANINGIVERVNAEVCKIYPQPKVKVIHERNFNAYLGGSIVGSLGSVKAFFIGEKDYEEFGSNILERKNMSWWVNKIT